ncbi:MAG: hypothetical protein ACI4MA_06920 [Treponema sp.]|nr:hypothetical protein [Spirochaetia bacterium]MDD7698584.1 hypothetical protein [Spirochaetia bacterium]MDY4211792.1 hypothetical protein [Treponema sp.]
MIDFSEIFANAKDFFKEKKNAAIITIVLVILFLLSLIVFAVQSCSQNSKSKTVRIEELPLVPDQKLLLPEGPSIPDGYALTRPPQEKWTKEDAEEFFTLPTEKEMQKLESANDRLIDEILGAAP